MLLYVVRFIQCMSAAGQEGASLSFDSGLQISLCSNLPAISVYVSRTYSCIVKTRYFPSCTRRHTATTCDGNDIDRISEQDRFSSVLRRVYSSTLYLESVPASNRSCKIARPVLRRVLLTQGLFTHRTNSRFLARIRMYIVRRPSLETTNSNKVPRISFQVNLLKEKNMSITGMSVKRKKTSDRVSDPIEQTIEEVILRSVTEAPDHADRNGASSSQRQITVPPRRKAKITNGLASQPTDETPPSTGASSIDFPVNGKARAKKSPQPSTTAAISPVSANKRLTTSADSAPLSAGSSLTSHGQASSTSSAVHSLTNGTRTLTNGKSNKRTTSESTTSASSGPGSRKRTTKKLKVDNGSSTSTSITATQEPQRAIQPKKAPTVKLSGLLAKRKTRPHEEVLALDDTPQRPPTQLNPGPRSANTPHKLEKLMRTRKKEGNSPWSWKGKPFTKMLYSPEDKRNIERSCYHAIKHKDGEVIKVGDSVLLRAAKGQQKPHIGKIACFWDSERGEMMMTIFWYWRPEEVPDKFRVPHGEMEVFVSSLRDDNFVSCIEEKCFVLTLHQYARFKAASKDYDTVYHRPLEVVVPELLSSINLKDSLPESNIDEQIVYFANLGFEGKSNRFWRYYFRSNRLRKYYLD